MNSLRESLASIPSAISSFVYENQINPQTVSSPSSLSGDDSSEKSHTIPAALIKEQWQIVLGLDACLPELKTAEDKCKALILTSEECSEERKWLVRHLVELRYRIKELEEIINDPNESFSETKVILGHHFTVQPTHLPTAKQHCDHCTGIIWSVVQASYVCTDCEFIVHHKCAPNIIRICAHVITTERKYPIDEICPEIGLAAQDYKCAECQANFDFKKMWTEPRLCDYSGLYYCPTCHWNSVSIIPARVIHNWDFSSHKVSRTSLQQINLLLDKPVIKLEEVNPKLFVFLQKLSVIKKIREDLTFMRKYLCECRVATEKKLLEGQIGNRRHLIQTPDVYSISDLVQAESGLLIEFLNRVYDAFEKHIRSCEICSGKGYICEICSNNEVIYPFDDGSVSCEKCLTIYHRICWTRHMQKCPRCARVEERKSKTNDAELTPTTPTEDIKNDPTTELN
ncbi:differentially expressed in FDCP 8 homolog isoform X2 [Hermetia illucens]|uniref:differentially expressed in FDCP 8 homolog isoform X2 n=1 Tax=Hermetia illucens TaxID=343691 RepID=UPI0018CC3D08|nr:differentially expressed in FDCP 8 homolog isoform X2 [Hermetia illucens]